MVFKSQEKFNKYKSWMGKVIYYLMKLLYGETVWSTVFWVASGTQQAWVLVLCPALLAQQWPGLWCWSNSIEGWTFPSLTHPNVSHKPKIIHSIGHLGAAQQAINTTLTYYDLIWSWYGQWHFTPRIHGLLFLTSLINVSAIFPLLCLLNTLMFHYIQQPASCSG